MSKKAWLSSLKEFRSLKGLAILLVVLIMLAGCYGSFPVTKQVYKANGKIDSGVLRNVVFWVFVIFPVYWLAMLVDAVVLNFIDFWFPSGELTSKNVSQDLRLEKSPDGREAILTITEGKQITQLRFVGVSANYCEVRDLQGELLGAARLNQAGNIELTDAQGKTTTRGALAQAARQSRVW